MNDVELLRRYVETRADAAFRELVGQKLGLVYSAALRQVGGNAHLAEEVAQAVFSALATQARRLLGHPSLTGWLYTTTRNVAAKSVRAQRRRARWESEAGQMTPTTTSPDFSSGDWQAISRVLDESMHTLAADDREAVLLRYFENHSLAAVGARFGISEDTARKRISRALEKLRRALERRGVTSTAAVLASALSHGAVSEAPGQVVATVASAALSTSAATGGAIAGIGLWPAGKVAVVTGTLVAAVIGTTFLLDRSPPGGSGDTAAAVPARDVTKRGAVSAVPDDDYDTSNIKALAAALIARPPSREKFIAVLAKLGNSRGSNALFMELGRQDFSVALRLAEFTRSVENAKAKAVWGHAEVNPERALQWALKHPQNAAESTIGNLYLQSWASGAFGAQRAALYAFIDRFPEKQEILTPRHDAISGIEQRAMILRSSESYRAIFEDPRAPALIVSLRSDPRVTGGLSDGRLLGLASSWGREKPEELLAFAARTTDPVARRALLDAAVGVYVELDPVSGLQWALRIDPDGSLGVVSRGINTWINTTNDPEAALVWVQADDTRKGHVDRVAGIVAARIGPKNYRRGYEIARVIVDENVRQKALQDVALFWRRDDAHFDYVKRSGIPELMWAAAFHYAGKQPERAAEMIALMPSGPLKAAAAERLRSVQKTPTN